MLMYAIILLILILIRKFMMGTKYKGKDVEDLISGKLFLIISYSNNDMIMKFIDYILKNNGVVILLLDSSNQESLKVNNSNLTKIKLNCLDLVEVDKILNLIKSQINKIDYYIHNTEYSISKETNKSLISNALIRYNNTVYFFTVMRILPLLDRGLGRVLHLSGDVYDYSSLLNIDNKQIVLKNVADIVNLSKSDSDDYSNSSLISIFTLQYLKNYTEREFDNILINSLNNGVDYTLLFSYIKSSSILNKLFSLFVVPLSPFFVRTSYWTTQSMLRFFFEKNDFELLNGGFYNSRLNVNNYGSILKTNKILYNLTIESIINEIKGLLNKDETESLYKYLNNYNNKKDD